MGAPLLRFNGTNCATSYLSARTANFEHSADTIPRNIAHTGWLVTDSKFPSRPRTAHHRPKGDTGRGVTDRGVSKPAKRELVRCRTDFAPSLAQKVNGLPTPSPYLSPHTAGNGSFARS
jgi:hypothetical protein